MAESSSAAANSNYDVFINHRGSDVKKTFASQLYRRLLSYGFRVFLDQPELQRGDYLTSQIEGAIGSAFVHVAIFSSGYAQSTWCLNELILMLESNSPIIPVFYYVKPAELRWTRGKDGGYAKALEELEKKTTSDPQTGEEKLRYDSSTIENWKNALSNVAGISGFELEACNGDEGELVDKVVERVLKKVKKPALDVARYPTGLEDKVNDFENTVLLQRQQSGKPQIVGIVGLGGVGKTTLAKELFNRKSSDCSRSCFLSDVRDNAHKSSLNSLQRELLRSLTGLDHPINSVAEGIGMLRKHLSYAKGLVIIDDVDHEDQVYALLSDQTILHSDSLILITSRSKDVLKRSGVQESSIYNLIGLSKQHSLELFCLHSFHQPHPLPEFEYLVGKFLEACGGLPLSLKVFGALLYGQDTSYWEDQLDKLQRILPKEIKQRLQISYDALDREEQQIFLDIACFFTGEDMDMAMRLWDGSGWNSLWGFRNIQNKCLVEVNSENKIKMHDHLRDLGREIADASLPRRLWRPTEKIDDLLQQSSVINEVRGIRMHHSVRGIRMLDHTDSDSDDDSSEMPWYQRINELLVNCLTKLCNIPRNTEHPFHGSGICMSKLQLLDTEDVLVDNIFTKVQSPNLIWLRWNNCPYSSLPSSISMKNLRFLQVQGKKLKTLWEKESEAPLQLRELRIDAFLWNIPKSIGQLKHLERIVIGPPSISRFSRLAKVEKVEYKEVLVCLQDSVLKESEMKALPESFADLINLHHIQLFRCSALERLPDSFGNLNNLQHIELSWCRALERLPESFCKLTKLQYLDLSYCTNLTMSSETLGNISTLEYINLNHCSKIEVLPPQVAHQRSLEELLLAGTNLKELPSSIGELSNLEVLAVGPLRDTLPPSLCDLKNLKELRFYECKELECLPASLGDLKNLKKLTIWDCNALKCLPASLGDLNNLKDLSIQNCNALKCLPPSLGDLKNLKVLKIQNCNALKCLPASLGLLTQLTDFRVTWCPLISQLPFKKEIKGERETLSDLESSIPNCILPRLQQLYIYRTGISEVSFAEAVCSNLRLLHVLACDDVVEVGTLPNTLIDLDFTSCKNLRKINCGLAKLQTLRIEDCRELEELPGIETLVSLSWLLISECVKLEELPRIETLVSLRSVYIRGWVKLKSIRGLGQLTNLETLSLSGCSELEELPRMETWVILKWLSVSGCVKLKNIQALGQLTKLEQLWVRGCSQLEEVEGIQHCMSLWRLDVRECPKLHWSVGVVEQLRQRLAEEFYM